MTNLEKMREVARLAKEKGYSKRQLDAIVQAVAKDTGRPVREVRRVFEASLLLGEGSR